MTGDDVAAFICLVQVPKWLRSTSLLQGRRLAVSSLKSNLSNVRLVTGHYNTALKAHYEKLYCSPGWLRLDGPSSPGVN